MRGRRDRKPVRGIPQGRRRDGDHEVVLLPSDRERDGSALRRVLDRIVHEIVDDVRKLRLVRPDNAGRRKRRGKRETLPVRIRPQGHKADVRDGHDIDLGERRSLDAVVVVHDLDAQFDMIGKRVDLADRLVRKFGAVRLAAFDRDHRVEAKLGLGADMTRIASRIVSEDMHDVHEFRKTPVLTAEEPVEDRDHRRHFAEVRLRIERLGRAVFHPVQRTEHESAKRIRGNVIHLGGREDH